MKKYQKAVTFSYDDGIEQDCRLAALLNRYGLKGTFNLNTGIQTEESSFELAGIQIRRMNQQDIGTLYQGHEIAVHGLTHASVSGMTEEELDRELGQDIENITRLYGEKPVGMAYAYGAWEETAVKWLREHGIRYARTVDSTHDFRMPDEPLLLQPTCHHREEGLFQLAERFLQEELQEGQQRLFYIWGHSYEFDINNDWDRMEEFCRVISGREDVFYGTNRECLELFGCI